MNPILEMKQIDKFFEIGTINENYALKKINFTVNKGDFISVIGGNGAGKSTLLNTISGAYPVDQGQIFVNGKNVAGVQTYQRAAHISRVFQDSKMGTASRLTIEENLAVAWKRGKKRGLNFGIKKKHRHIFQNELKLLDLNLENRLKTEVGLLSGGQRQALTLLMATIVTPKLLLLDEHTAALDPKTSEMVMNLTQKMIAEKNITTLMITHSMEQAINFGNRLIMMDNGRIVVDVSGKQKDQLTVTDLLTLFKEKSGINTTEDTMLLS